MNDAPTAAEPADSGAAGPPGASTGSTGAAGAAPSSGAPLRRSRRHKVVAGVCGGLGRQWDIDPVIFRVVLAVLSIGGLGLIFYGFAWLLVPLDGEEENEGRRLLSGRVEGSALTALLCALAGCALFLTTLGKGSMMSFAIMVTLAVAGAAYWSRRRRRAQAEGLGSVDAATAQAVADARRRPPPAGAQHPSWWRDPRTEALLRRGYLWGPEDTRLDITYEFTHGSPTAPARAAAGPRPRARPAHRRRPAPARPARPGPGHRRPHLRAGRPGGHRHRPGRLPARRAGPVPPGGPGLRAGRLRLGLVLSAWWGARAAARSS
ncbi:PspC domain-containing protein [Streptomyces noursei]|nr:PspC domain-containing protein [Streptomyces noursei]